MKRFVVMMLALVAACGFEGHGVIDGGDIGGDDASDVEHSSCVDLPATCGPNGTDSCCSTATQIPGGTFYRSYDVSTDGMYSNMSYPATVSSFTLDKYEVTVGRFRQFVNAGMGTATTAPISDAGARPLNGSAAQGGWSASWNNNLSANAALLKNDVKCDPTYQTWTDTVGANESLPMNCVTWYEAMAFCIWDGGYLPTEAEWNYAASGGGEQRAYPWSNPAMSTVTDCSYANFDIDIPSGTRCIDGANRVGNESPKGDGKWGHSDFAGNVLEWVLDWDASPYPTTTCNDCATLSPSGGRIVRGGSFYYGADFVRTGTRKALTSTGKFADVGFRCVVAAP